MDEQATPEKSLLAYKCQSADCGFYFTQEVGWGNFFCPRCKYTTRPIFDYYRMFGLERDFSLPELKEKYKKLSLRYHPDKNSNEMSNDFLVVRKGYDVLSNETEKEIYDHDLMLYHNFIEGKTILQEDDGQSKKTFKIKFLLLSGFLLMAAVFYQFQNFYYAGSVGLLWLTVGLIWKENFFKIIVFLIEIIVVGIIGYTLFNQLWWETLILSLGLLIYMILKYHHRINKGRDEKSKDI